MFSLASCLSFVRRSFGTAGTDIAIGSSYICTYIAIKCTCILYACPTVNWHLVSQRSGDRINRSFHNWESLPVGLAEPCACSMLVSSRLVLFASLSLTHAYRSAQLCKTSNTLARQMEQMDGSMEQRRRVVPARWKTHIRWMDFSHTRYLNHCRAWRFFSIEQRCSIY